MSEGLCVGGHSLTALVVEANIFGVPWLPATLVQSLPLWSHGILLCTCLFSYEDTNHVALEAMLTQYDFILL